MPATTGPPAQMHARVCHSAFVIVGLLATCLDKPATLVDSIIASCDLDHNSTTLYELDLMILETFMPTKNELNRSRISKVRALLTDRYD